MIQDRARGAFIGLAVGDALGTPLEFKARDTYTHVTDMIGGGPFNLQPGEWTDDTSMALCLADSLIVTDVENEYSLDKENVIRHFIKWWLEGYNSVNGRCFDIGTTTRNALDTFRRTGELASYSAWTVGNGGIMRLSPAVIVAGNCWPMAQQGARDQSAVTHNHPDCMEAAEALAGYLWAYINDVPRKELSFANARINTAYKTGMNGVDRNLISSLGYAVDTIEAAIWAVDNSGSFEEAVLKAVNLGDDADTVGAVAGQIAGAKWGFDAIPDHWVTQLAWSDFLIQTADELYYIGLTK